MHKILQINLKTFGLLYLISILGLIAMLYFNNMDGNLFLLTLLFIFLNSFTLLFVWLVYKKLMALLKEESTALGREINNNLNQGFLQQESLQHLLSVIHPLFPFPNTRGWAASPDFICVIFKYIMINRPVTILELGSGVSSLYTGQLLKEKKPEARLTTIDHSEEYAEKTKLLIEQTGLTEQVTVNYCPLRNHSINGKDWLWYDLSEIKINNIGLLVVDGPIGSLQKKARYPAFPLLAEKMNKEAFIILDDYNRTDEKELVQDWLKENRDLKLVEEINTEKGTAVLKYKRT